MYDVKYMMYDRLQSYTSYTIHHISRISLFLIVTSLSGCLSSKQLGNNVYLLTSQTVRGNKKISTESLESLIPQKPNRRILALPITPPLWFYQLGLRKYNHEAAVREFQAKTNEFEQQSQQLANQPDALKKLNRQYGRQLKRLRVKAEEGNWIMRSLGEPPSYFAEADAKANAAKMQKYLSDKGFFNAKATYKLDTLRRRQIRVNYLVAENEGFFLRNIVYNIADPRVDSIVRKSFDKSRLKVGERFDFDNMSGERIRIESLLRDQGYYAFSRQYIRATDVDTVRRGNDRRFRDGLEPGDSTRRNVDVALQIVNPPGKSAHPIYHFGEVDVRISPDATQPIVAGVSLDTVKRNGITYLLGGRDISVRLLDAKIQVRPNYLYSQTDYRDTQRQLFVLNQFKFVNLNFVDTTNRLLRTLITATPLDKYEATAEGGATGLLYQGKGFPGGFGSLIFRVRNLFGGLETLETSVRYGLEAQTGFVPDPNSNRAVYTSQELGISSSLIFPQILFPGPIRFKFNRYAPRTQISLSYNNTYRPDFKRSLLRASMAYNWQTTAAKQFSFLIADINLINANPGTNEVISNAFQAQLDSLRNQGSTVYLSFRRSLSSSFSFAYTYNTNTPGQNRRANFLRAVVESGGTTLNFFTDAQLRNLFNTTDTTGLQFYKFLRVNVDYRHYIPLRSRTTLAFRFNTGLVYGYGSNRTAPYEKLFFAGGSNSIRAWLPRRLGPGSEWPQKLDDQPVYNPKYPGQKQLNYAIEKPGDMIIEGSAELRGRLFHLGADVNGAIFIDAGNVWTLTNNINRPGTVFKFDTFFPQIAVGTGVGLRFDFSFFVIRFDGGIKVWDPARRIPDNNKPDGIDDQRFILPKFSFNRLSSGPNPLVINFGIGYPF
ncbi:Outer membrane protein assembly factor BamA [Spirosoma endophyticum]|uniref:Outer membrane protein assembly factor BamA n=2 Tax=Spirosoma endophyticum TaxID=662367 RepID=A0A1I1GH12_9BACT|nr:Outer membrane protein assembly factor BamA [Spirosoma endophyticum]